MAMQTLKQTFTSSRNSEKSSNKIISSSHHHHENTVVSEKSSISKNVYDVNVSMKGNWFQKDELSISMEQNRLLGKDDFENECVTVHNEYRKRHGSEPLQLNKAISKASKQWAEDLAKRDKMDHSNNTHFGENVFCGWSHESGYVTTAKECVSKWYDEIIDFEFGAEPTILRAGHFTQVVWKDTKEIGIGTAKSKSGKVYVVVNYSPPGNIAGQFATKVPPPGFMSMPPPNKTKKSDNNILLKPNHPTQTKTTNVQTRNKDNNTKSGEEKRSSGFSDLAKKLKNLAVGDDLCEFEKECLSAHNEYRSKHGVQPLTLNKRISKVSEEWAKHLTVIGRMEHRNQNEYGENIFYSWSSDPNHAVTGRQPVDSWYSEIKDHVFGRDPSSLKSGHFTQVVWRDSRELGVAWAKDKNGCIFVVANYYPPGNYVGSFAENVPPPLRH